MARLIPLLIIVIAALTGCSDFNRGYEEGSRAASTQTANAAAAPTSVTSAAAPTTEAPVELTVPTVKGRNGGVVYDELTRLGFSNIQLASGDSDRTVVVLPQNWKAVSIEPATGSKMSSDEAIVVTLTHN